MSAFDRYFVAFANQEEAFGNWQFANWIRSQQQELAVELERQVMGNVTPWWPQP